MPKIPVLKPVRKKFFVSNSISNNLNVEFQDKNLELGLTTFRC